MKTKLFIALIFAIVLICLPAIASAQDNVDITRADDQTKVSLSVDVDSTGLTASTVTSQWFSASKYLGNSFYTYPVQYTKLVKSTKGKPRITTTIEGSNDQTNVAVVDTMGILADSIETYQSGTLNLNNKKYWYYRIKHTGTSGNRADATAGIDLIFIKP